MVRLPSPLFRLLALGLILLVGAALAGSSTAPSPLAPAAPLGGGVIVAPVEEGSPGLGYQGPSPPGAAAPTSARAWMASTRTSTP